MGQRNLLVESDLEGSLTGPIAHSFEFGSFGLWKERCANTHTDVPCVGGESDQLSLLMVKRDAVPDLFLSLRQEGAEIPP